MNPNYLLKDELQYELLARGITSDCDVQTLRKLFRSLVAEKLQVELGNLRSQSVDDLYECVQHKVLELQDLITQHRSELVLLAPRFRTRLSHLRGRLRHLTELNPGASDKITAQYQYVRERLDSIESSLPNLDGTHHTAQEEEGSLPADNTSQEEVPTQDNRLCEQSQDRIGTGRVSTMTGAGQMTSVNEENRQMFTPHLYQRLPHPLSHLLKELPIVDGMDANILCEFLLKVIKIRQAGQMNDSAVYEVMYPYCRGELLALVTQAVNSREKFENFHARLLRHLIPSREMSHLRITRYERVQLEEESFSNYVQAIKDAGLVLRINEREAQVVERIIEGLTPNQRARFVFQPAPLSLRELERLGIVDRNIAYADRSRADRVSEVTIAEVESRADNQESGVLGRPRTTAPRQRTDIVCFYCRKTGHMQNRCFRRLSQRGKPASTVASSRS